MSGEPDLHVVLVEPEIPPNTGTIGRLCMATGARLHLVHPLGFTMGDKELRRAGLDYWKELDLREWESFSDYREAYEEAEGGSKRWYFSTHAGREFWEVNYGEGDQLVFGPETRGLPKVVLAEEGECCVRIPMEAGRSLNLAVAAGVAVYEALRQIRRGGAAVPERGSE